MTHSDSLVRACLAGEITPSSRDIGNKIFSLYWCSQNSDEEETMLYDALDAVRSKGRHVYRAFTQLVIDIHIEQGPRWLDRLIDGNPIPTDRETLDLAREGLNVIQVREGCEL